MTPFQRIRTALALLLLATAVPAAAADAPAPAGPAEASYVRICRDRRGNADRRACHSRDESRTAIAFNG